MHYFLLHKYDFDNSGYAQEWPTLSKATPGDRRSRAIDVVYSVGASFSQRPMSHERCYVNWFIVANGPLNFLSYFAISIQLKPGYQLRFWGKLVVGVKNEAEMFMLWPQGIGLKYQFQEESKDEGFDPEGLPLDFGVFEVLNRFTCFARLEFLPG